MNVEDCVALVNRLLPEPHASLLRGLLFGTTSSLPPDITEALIVTGTLHIAALSGMNISILATIMDRLMTPIVGKRVSLLCVLVVIIWFIWFVGPTPSLVRAGIMGGLSVIATLIGRQYWAIISWGVTVILMLMVQPGWLGDLSFQLSASATLGIILFGRSANDTQSARTLERANSDDCSTPIKQSLYSKIWHSLPMVVRDNLHITLSAQIFTIPLILLSFRRISIISPLANLAIGWVVAPLTVLGWITIFVGFLSYPLGYMAALIDWVLLEYLIRTVQILQFVPFASLIF